MEQYDGRPCDVAPLQYDAKPPPVRSWPWRFECECGWVQIRSTADVSPKCIGCGSLMQVATVGSNVVRTPVQQFDHLRERLERSIEQPPDHWRWREWAPAVAICVAIVLVLLWLAPAS